MKAQPIRLADVFIVGPIMIAGGIALTKYGRQGLGVALTGLGLATIVYNAKNYAELRDEMLKESRDATP